ncbi:tRNA (cytidine(34)-2'-O)-methyltransferase [Thalassobaculum fulvum]|uniref:tRNA (cytidine(34)-2'-O)-methyltransferase n=1 Tax=Thalassobaculum fulvum TaxID=1633335 RepID=A0A918XTB0_9PROT|nr:tRNA (cytidine(34)-2'-O)-methyltransferase [Thalassobaculum fulvum]GHD53198.1 tRNA (cytidine(34)-2'-O)-methyltransferase [Thalassobaculum fulvum]
MRLVLFEPDIPQNTGTILRLAACLGVGVDIVEPCGFVWSEPRLRRAGMDYLEFAEVRRHSSWSTYLAARQPGRLVVLSTRGSVALPDVRFAPDDRLLLGRESAGVPDAVHAAADLAVRIPMVAGARSLNVAVSAGIVVAEALRQTAGWP